MPDPDILVELATYAADIPLVLTENFATQVNEVIISQEAWDAIVRLANFATFYLDPESVDPVIVDLQTHAEDIGYILTLPFNEQYEKIVIPESIWDMAVSLAQFCMVHIPDKPVVDQSARPVGAEVYPEDTTSEDPDVRTRRVVGRSGRRRRSRSSGYAEEEDE